MRENVRCNRGNLFRAGIRKPRLRCFDQRSVFGEVVDFHLSQEVRLVGDGALLNKHGLSVPQRHDDRPGEVRCSCDASTLV